MAGWHHWLNRHESEWTPGVSDGQGGLVCYDYEKTLTLLSKEEEPRLPDLNFVKTFTLFTLRKHFERKEIHACWKNSHLCSFLLPTFLHECLSCLFIHIFYIWTLYGDCLNPHSHRKVHMKYKAIIHIFWYKENIQMVIIRGTYSKGKWNKLQNLNFCISPLHFVANPLWWVGR